MFSLTIPVLEEDIYIVDILPGTAILISLLDFEYQRIKLLRNGGMLLHKWCSNAEKKSTNQCKDIPTGDSEICKTLRVLWISKETIVVSYIELGLHVFFIN